MGNILDISPLPSFTVRAKLSKKVWPHKQTPNENTIMSSKTRNADSYADDDSGQYNGGQQGGTATYTSEKLEYEEVAASKPVWGQDNGGKWGRDKGERWEKDDGCKRKKSNFNISGGWWCGWGYSSMYIWFIVAPIVIWVILFTTKPSFVTDTVNGSVVINNQKLILWVLILSIIAWILIYAFYYCKY